MKEVKAIQDETEQKINKLIHIVDGEPNDIFHQNPKFLEEAFNKFKKET